MAYFQSELGVGYRFSDHLVFFGGAKSGPVEIAGAFPDLLLRRIRQTHSALVVEASDLIQEADAHFTSERLVAPVIATADCIPLMIYCRQTERVAAVHAGWKGVQSQIATNVLKTLRSTGSTSGDFSFYIGPHIHQVSFETDQDVFAAMVAVHPELQTESFSTFKDSKYYINLAVLIRFQIEKTLNKKVNLLDVSIDTKADQNFHSYRRDSGLSGRNLSIIVRL